MYWWVNSPFPHHPSFHPLPPLLPTTPRSSSAPLSSNLPSVHWWACPCWSRSEVNFLTLKGNVNTNSSTSSDRALLNLLLLVRILLRGNGLTAVPFFITFFRWSLGNTDDTRSGFRRRWVPVIITGMKIRGRERRERRERWGESPRWDLISGILLSLQMLYCACAHCILKAESCCLFVCLFLRFQIF